MQTSFVKFRQGTLHIIGQKCYPSVRRNGDAKGRYVFLLEGGGGSGYFRIFLQKNRGPPTSQNGLVHDPSQIPTQKHLTLPPPPPRQK